MTHRWMMVVCAIAVPIATHREPAFAGRSGGESGSIKFDLPPVAAAHAVDATSASVYEQADSERSADGDDRRHAETLENVLSSNDDRLITFELRLSSMISSPKVPRIDQWIVRCVPRDAGLMVADYSPRTEVASHAVGPLKIKRTKEANDTYGMSVDGAYGHLVRGNAGADHGRKRSEMVEYERHAPVQAVIASGTIQRGRGVYYKMRWSGQQVLEGEKSFRLCLRVPAHWRCGLVDVSVIAQSERKVFAGLDSEIQTLGQAHFTVAVYRADDEQAKHLAHDLVRAEAELRRHADRAMRAGGQSPLSVLVRHWTTALDVDRDEDALECVDRLVRGAAHPHVDRQLGRLPMNLRVAALDYCEIREAFLALKQSSTTSHVLNGSGVLTKTDAARDSLLRTLTADRD